MILVPVQEVQRIRRRALRFDQLKAVLVVAFDAAEDPDILVIHFGRLQSKQAAEHCIASTQKSRNDIQHSTGSTY